MRITILRGISGAGKTTWIKKHATDAFVVSADSYFYQAGTYVFDPSKLQENHERCFREFMDAVLRKEAWIIVDNTNIESWEYAPYVIAGKAYAYEVEILTLEVSYDVARARKNLLADPALRRTFDRLNRETKNMPARFRSLHRSVNNET